MRKASVLLLGLLVVFLLTHCGPKPPPPVEEEEPVVIEEEEEPEPPPPPPEPRILKQDDVRAIHFDFDKYDLRPGDREILNRNASLLKEFPDAKIRIEGNCDERGTVEYNLALGEKRARAAKDYLVNLGIDPDRISIITYGKERSNRCHSDDCWSKDRRDDFVILSQ